MNENSPHWTLESVQALRALVKDGAPASLISLKLKRSIADVRAKISDLGLTPTADLIPVRRGSCGAPAG